MPTSSVGVVSRRQFRTGRNGFTRGHENGSSGRGEHMGTDRSVHAATGRRGVSRLFAAALGQSGQSPCFSAVWIGEELVGGLGRAVNAGRRGVTLIEMLIVMAVIALVAGLAAPSVSAGLDSLRLRSTSDAIIGFLNTALARADTRQQVVEILISQQDGTITATSGDQGFKKRLDIVSPIKILSVQPELAADVEDQNQTRRFLVYPGGSVPKIAIEIGNSRGRKRMVSIDPVTGVPQANAQ
jgi:prepilin-type N-terminal cleavage/methylation domain-containing protein